MVANTTARKCINFASPAFEVTITVLLGPTQVKTRDCESGIIGHSRCLFLSHLYLEGVAQ